MPSYALDQFPGLKRSLTYNAAIQNAIYCEAEKCPSYTHIRNTTVAQYLAQKRAGRYTPGKTSTSPFNLPSLPSPVPGEKPIPMEGSSKSLYHCRIGAIIWPDCVDKYLFPNDNTEDVAKLKESEDDVREFSQYKMDYHIFLHYWATNKSVKMEEAIEQVEIEMWRVCCEKGVVDATKGGERRGAICAQ